MSQEFVKDALRDIAENGNAEQLAKDLIQWLSIDEAERFCQIYEIRYTPYDEMEDDDDNVDDLIDEGFII